LTSMAWCTMSSYCLDIVLLIYSVCKFCRGCAKQFGGSGMISGSHSGFCITILHQATHRLLCSNSLQGKKHSCHHSITILSDAHSKWLLAVTYFMYGPQGDTFCNHGVLQIAMAELQNIQKEAFHWCFQHWQNQWKNSMRERERVCARMCVCVCTPTGPTLEVIR
jgi:hypothetical protein